MGLFRRRSKDDADPPVEAASESAAGSPAGSPAEPDDGSREGRPKGDPAGAGDRPDEPFSSARGPFDASEVGDDEDRIDLGALRVPPLDGLELRLELDEGQQSVVSAHAMLGGSTVTLQAFAAPRTRGLWPEIRAEIAETVVAQGGSAQVVDGPLGPELAATIASRGADGRTFENRVRFLGVDGPRWFLRAVISGAAAVDDTQAAPLVDLVRGVVVARDDQARPPREVLPLRVPMPPEPAPPDDPGGPEGSAAEASGPRAADLKPFERGPEITEVR